MQQQPTVLKEEDDAEVVAAIDLLQLLYCGPKPTLPYAYETWRLGEYLLARGWATGSTTTGLDVSPSGRELLSSLNRVRLH
jgi:hypothetical protein